MRDFVESVELLVSGAFPEGVVEQAIMSVVTGSMIPP